MKKNVLGPFIRSLTVLSGQRKVYVMPGRLGSGWKRDSSISIVISWSSGSQARGEEER
jgi:hypothetical protein